MKITVRTIQFLVGILFIISGIVKANDPMGLSYKMEEFFEIWNASLGSGGFFAKDLLISFFEFLHDHSVFLSVFMITLEIVAGVALIVGWKKNFILYLLLILILFFTFLTGYAYLSENPDGSPKFTNCGCFGDCLPISPLTSFLKDIALLIMISFLIYGKKYIQPFLSSRTIFAVIAGSLVFTLALQWYVLNYLPVVDCLPFKTGNNIPDQMKPPPGSVPDSIAMRFVYEKDGRQFEFAPEELPADFETYTFKERIDKLIRKGNADPPIKGFSLTGITDTDSTQAILSQPLSIIAFALAPNSTKWVNDFREMIAKSNEKGIPVHIATSAPEQYRQFLNSYNIQVPVYACDFTVIRTAARTNPAFYVLKEGTIVNKYSYRNLDELTNDLDELK